jgi:hypothetical protein
MTPLRRRMIEDMRIRNLSPRTQRVYVEQVSRFARHFELSPEQLGQEEIRAWQIHLVEERRLAASSISVAVASGLSIPSPSNGLGLSKTTFRPADNPRNFPLCRARRKSPSSWMR